MKVSCLWVWVVFPVLTATMDPGAASSSSEGGRGPSFIEAVAQALCPVCNEPEHPRYSATVLCGLGHCPVAKWPGKCPACREDVVQWVDNIANANGVWFHKKCAVSVLHPFFYSPEELLERARALTSDVPFLNLMEAFFRGSGNYILSCSPGAGKTTVASMIAKATGVEQTINLMFNKHNMVDAIAKGICQSYTYHSLACQALLRYLRTEVATYKNLGENTFTLAEDDHVVNAIAWTLFPPTDEADQKRNLKSDETRTSIASGMYALFINTASRAINLAMHNCFGLPVP